MGVAFYRKKPVTIEAILLDGENVAEILEWIDRCGGQALPIHLSPQMASAATGSILIHTLNGDVKAEPGEYVIRGVKGEFYPCEAEIFVATHDPDPDA